MHEIKGRFYQLLMKSMMHPLVSIRVYRFTQSSKSKWLIPWFVKLFKINTDQNLQPVSSYQTLSDFFIREIKFAETPVGVKDNIYTSPVEATIKDYGKITEDKKYYIKGKYYSFEELTGTSFGYSVKNSHFMILYLSPKNYHRFHAPINGNYPLLERLGTSSYPVNDIGTKYVGDVFSKNHRVIFGMNQDLLVAVGAMNINSIIHSAKKVNLTRGEELGYFTFGSTIILFFMDKDIAWSEHVHQGAAVFVGEELAYQRENS